MAILVAMDEILIGEKNYISSKRAAKVTGYAKDYVGQLCREGRVPARLVGRSWYVLETAIHDHRFGTPGTEHAENPEGKEAEPHHATWEAPRYEAAESEVLPPVTRSQEPQEDIHKSDATSEQNLHDAWQAWFSRIGEAPPPEEPNSDEATAQEQIAEEKSPAEEENVADQEEVPIVIRAIHHELPQERMVPARREDEDEVRVISEERLTSQTSPYATASAIRLVSMMIALISLTIAVAGSGYIDRYIISFDQAHLLAGVSVYNK